MVRATQKLNCVAQYILIQNMSWCDREASLEVLDEETLCNMCAVLVRIVRKTYINRVGRYIAPPRVYALITVRYAKRNNMFMTL